MVPGDGRWPASAEALVQRSAHSGEHMSFVTVTIEQYDPSEAVNRMTLTHAKSSSMSSSDRPWLITFTNPQRRTDSASSIAKARCCVGVPETNWEASTVLGRVPSWQTSDIFTLLVLVMVIMLQWIACPEDLNFRPRLSQPVSSS